VTGGSRTTLASGQAVYEAARDALRQLKERAARLWEKKPEEVSFSTALSVRWARGLSP
jgi:CO/xanthine dehydrogenase Mo-binding subunit